MMVRALLAMIAFAAATAVTVSRAAEFPLWEAGVGVAVLNFPDYRGSDQRHTLVLPFPYLVYRGDFMKADKEGVRGQFYKDDRLDLQLSANGSIPVDSSDNSARRGMSNLDPTFEIGPNLAVTLLRKDTTHLNLRFPVRAVIATNLSHARDEGWVFQPQLNVDFYDIIPGLGWNLGLAVGPLYGNSRYHNYFYGVAPQFATPQRPAYDARGGYGGMQFIASLSKRYPSYWVGGFVRADTLSGAVFEDSPLVRQKEAYAAGFAIAWVFGQSKKRVDSVE
jgi:MipA family protein